jgi:hypothetical protein
METPVVRSYHNSASASENIHVLFSLLTENGFEGSAFAPFVLSTFS